MYLNCISIIYYDKWYLFNAKILLQLASWKSYKIWYGWYVAPDNLWLKCHVMITWACPHSNVWPWKLKWNTIIVWSVFIDYRFLIYQLSSRADIILSSTCPWLLHVAVCSCFVRSEPSGGDAIITGLVLYMSPCAPVLFAPNHPGQTPLLLVWSPLMHLGSFYYSSHPALIARTYLYSDDPVVAKNGSCQPVCCNDHCLNPICLCFIAASRWPFR